VAIRGLIERLRSVDDLPRNQTALTAMTNTGPARPTNWDVARLGQLQNALVGRGLPVRGDATARERYQRTGVGVVLGQMGSSGRCVDDARSHRLSTLEDFDVNP